jgi:hypothetical protein
MEKFVWSFLRLNFSRLEGCQKLALDLGAWESLLVAKELRAQAKAPAALESSKAAPRI